MLGDVEAGAFVLGVDSDADEGVEEFEEDDAADESEGGCEECGESLIEELSEISFEEALGESGSGDDGAGGEDSGENCSEETSDAVDSESVEGIVVAEFEFDGAGVIAEETGKEADDDPREGSDHPASGGDGDEPGDGSGTGPEKAGFAAADPFDGGPGEGSGSGGEVGGDEGVDGELIGGESAAGVETEPSEPEESRADEGDGEVVREERFVAVADPFADEDRADEGGDSGADVDDRSSGEIEGGEDGVRVGGIEEAGGRPDPMGEGAIDEGAPEDGIENHSLELHPFGEGAADESGSDDEEHHLIDHVEGAGDRVLHGDDRRFGNGIPDGDDIAEEEIVCSADESAQNVGAEGEAVTPADPDKGHDADEGDALHHDAEDIFFADEA